MRTLVLCFAAIAAMFGSGAAAQTAITHANLIDGTGAPPQADVTIVMTDGRIAAIGPSAQVAVPAGAAVVDAAGRFVVPGIINAHGHVGPPPRDPQLRQYALYGVTTTTSMYFDQDDIVAFKAAQRAGDFRGARILTVKYRFMSPPFIPAGQGITPGIGDANLATIAGRPTAYLAWQGKDATCFAFVSQFGTGFVSIAASIDTTNPIAAPAAVACTAPHVPNAIPLSPSCANAIAAVSVPTANRPPPNPISVVPMRNSSGDTSGAEKITAEKAINPTSAPAAATR